MCLLAVLYHVVPGYPVLLCANREEAFDRPSLPPALFPGPPAYTCGVDLRAGGTWLGVNELGLVVAVTNRPQMEPRDRPRSRGLLCRELLACGNANAAAELVTRELASNAYAHANFLCLDQHQGSVLHGRQRVERIHLPAGLHLLTNSDLNDPHDRRGLLARDALQSRPMTSATEFVESARQVCALPFDPKYGASIVVRGQGRGTVSSLILCVADHRADSMMWYCPEAPDVGPYEPYSDRLPFGATSTPRNTSNQGNSKPGKSKSDDENLLP